MDTYKLASALRWFDNFNLTLLERVIKAKDKHKPKTKRLSVKTVDFSRLDKNEKVITN